MGSGGFKREMKEIDSTRGSLRDDAFFAILDRIEDAGAEITSDEEVPLYTESGREQFEIGFKRTVEFSLGHKDFRLTRRVQTHILQGAGIQKHIEDLETPKTELVLFTKPDTSSDWVSVDLEALL